MTIGAIEPRELKFLTKVLDAYCRDNAITDEIEREDCGAVLISLFSRGNTDPEQLRRSLDEARTSASLRLRA